MNETLTKPMAAEECHDSERTKQVTVAGWTAGLTAFFAVGAVASSPSWPVAFGVAAVAAMVATTCYFILNPRTPRQP